jgi:hypothetical protein
MATSNERLYWLTSMSDGFDIVESPYRPRPNAMPYRTREEAEEAKNKILDKIIRDMEAKGK